MEKTEASKKLAEELARRKQRRKTGAVPREEKPARELTAQQIDFDVWLRQAYLWEHRWKKRGGKPDHGFLFCAEVKPESSADQIRTYEGLLDMAQEKWDDIPADEKCGDDARYGFSRKLPGPLL